MLSRFTIAVSSIVAIVLASVGSLATVNDSAITADQAKRIPPGMTLADAVQILGPPRDETDGRGIAPVRLLRNRWSATGDRSVMDDLSAAKWAQEISSGKKPRGQMDYSGFGAAGEDLAAATWVGESTIIDVVFDRVTEIVSRVESSASDASQLPLGERMIQRVRRRFGLGVEELTRDVIRKRAEADPHRGWEP